MAPRRYRFRRVPRRPVRNAVAVVLTVALLAALVWGIGFVRFVDRVPRDNPAGQATADAVVVLTGGSRRLEEGFALLAAERAPVLFVSGVDQRVNVRELQALVPAAASSLPDDLAECCLVLGYGASDTIGNARETGAWMALGNRQSIILVTSNYHMPRAHLEFEHAMPGVTIAEHPVVPADVRLDAWWRYPGTLALLANEWTKYLFASGRILAAEWIGRLRGTA